MDELWKDIPGYEGLYEASSCGRIRTKEGKTTRSARYDIRHWKQRVLKPRKSTIYGKERYHVSLWKNGKPKDYSLPRLIALTWVSGFTDGMTVNHIDNDPTNNRIDNLEWVSLAENIRKGFDTGAYSSKCPVSLLTPSGETLSFTSLSECSRYLGRNESYVCLLLKKDKDIATSINGDQYKIVK